jgi:predicted transcriptional regulator
MEDKILNALKSGMMKAGEISEVTGVDKKEVAKILKKLKNEGKVVAPKRCFYGLP